MFWETLAAIFLLLVSSPIWIPVALIWAVLQTVYILFIGLVAFVDDTGSVQSILLLVSAAIKSGLQAALDIPVFIWNWAKFQHPWWATIIAAVLATAGSGSK